MIVCNKVQMSGLADTTAAWSSLASLKCRIMLYLPDTSLPRLSWKEVVQRVLL